MKTISYYELLGMIKEDKAPNKIKVHLTSEPREYRMIFDSGECNYYELIGEVTEDYKYYLSDSYLESMMFDKTIEILDKKIPDKLKIEQDTSSNYYIRNENGTKCYLTTHSKMIAETLNQVIDYIESKGE